MAKCAEGCVCGRHKPLTPNRRAELSERMKKRWEDPTFRSTVTEAVSQGVKKQWENPERRATQAERMTQLNLATASERMKKRWEDPTFRSTVTEAVSQGAKKQWENPEFRATQAELWKQRREDPEFQAARGAAAAEALKKMWSDPEYREAQSKRTKQLWADPSFRAAQKEGLERYWSDPECRAAHAEGMRRYWESVGVDPDYVQPEDRRGCFAKVGAILRERDGDLCQLCLEPIDFSIKGSRVEYDPGMPSVDHIVPVSWVEGTDDPDNWWLAHFGCNSRKSARYSGRSDGTMDIRR